ncbi:restriction endonuclease subunit S [Micromonospora sp. NPDC005194]|uniref:restriction endonuclease subunit S n=1 Tax=Micromonospora sp. NPDC005194 TaxID=3156870 RepID=UPI0033B3FA8F
MATPIKRLARVSYGLGQPPRLSAEGVPIIRATNITDGLIVRENLIFAAKSDLPLDRAPLLRSGEILVVRSGACTGDSAIVTDMWAGSAPGYDLRLTPQFAEPRFLAYALRSRPVRGQIEIARSRAAQPHLNAEELGEIRIDVPNKDEQRRIADFLDGEAGKIDALVSKKQRVLSLLDEKINSRILEFIGSSQLVGLADPSTSVIPIRRALAKLVRPADPDGDVVTAFRDGQVVARSARRPSGYTLPTGTEAQGQFVQTGDVVIHGLDGFAGAIGTSESSGNCSPVYHVCVPRDRGNALFLGRLLRVLAITGYLGLFATSTRERAVDFRNWDGFGRIPIPAVPPRLQEEIGGWIGSARPLRSAVNRSFVLAEELRQALITAAVTGQFDVSTARGAEL